MDASLFWFNPLTDSYLHSTLDDFQSRLASATKQIIRETVTGALNNNLKLPAFYTEKAFFLGPAQFLAAQLARQGGGRLKFDQRLLRDLTGAFEMSFFSYALGGVHQVLKQRSIFLWLSTCDPRAKDNFIETLFHEAGSLRSGPPESVF